jgi:hypothetical protein
MDSQSHSGKRKHAVISGDKRLKTNEGTVIKTEAIITPEPIQIRISRTPLIELPAKHEFNQILEWIKMHREMRTALRYELMQNVNGKLKSVRETIRHFEMKRDYIPNELLNNDLSAKYEEQIEIQTRLKSRVASFQTSLSDIKQNFENYKYKLNERKYTLRYETTQLEQTFEQQEKTLQIETEKLSNLVNFYRKLSGLEIRSIGECKYRCRVRVHHEELVYNIECVDGTLDYELLSHSVPADNLESILKMDINIDESDGPSLLFKVVSSLMRHEKVDVY